jgi:hypothetical protein
MTYPASPPGLLLWQMTVAMVQRAQHNQHQDSFYNQRIDNRRGGTPAEPKIPFHVSLGGEGEGLVAMAIIGHDMRPACSPWGRPAAQYYQCSIATKHAI